MPLNVPFLLLSLPLPSLRVDVFTLAPSPPGELNLGQSLLLNEFCAGPSPHTPPASTRNCPLNEGHPPLLAAHWLKRCWAGCLPILHWLLPRSNFLSPRWRLVEADVWCLDWLSSRGSLFLWAGCRGIEEDLRAHCDPFKFWRKSNSHSIRQYCRNINRLNTFAACSFGSLTYVLQLTRVWEY